MRVCRFITLWPLIAMTGGLWLFTISPAAAARLGGAYYVDDAEIGKVGSCEIESWGSLAANADHILVFSPACVFNLGVPVELGTNVIKMRSSGDPGLPLLLTAKTVPLPMSSGRFGVAVAGAIIYDPIDRTNTGAILNIPISLDLSKALRFNVNVGLQYSANPQTLFATGGVGFSWNFVKQWSLISEVFAVMEPGQSNPRFQSGLRYSPTKLVDYDIIYGRNLTGEGANWITVGLTVRVGDQ